jgi:hypothetical protein
MSMRGTTRGSTTLMRTHLFKTMIIFVIRHSYRSKSPFFASVNVINRVDVAISIYGSCHILSKRLNAYLIFAIMRLSYLIRPVNLIFSNLHAYLRNRFDHLFRKWICLRGHFSLFLRCQHKLTNFSADGTEE